MLKDARGQARANEAISEIISVVILMELSRAMIFYIREHRESRSR